MITYFLLYCTTGLTIGFGHCLGMCGPIVITLNLNVLPGKKVMASMLYHSGRITTYAILGGLMGATGSFTMVTSRIESIQKTVMIFSGFLIVIMGLVTLGVPIWRHTFAERFHFGNLISKGVKILSGSKSTMAYYPLGLLFGLLPCGPVYTALIGAARVGMESTPIYQGIFAGIGLMTAFGLGTVPALILITKISDWGIGKYRQVIYKVGSLLMITFGIYFIIKAIHY